MNNRKKRTLIDWIVLGIVVIIAMVVIALSFSNTAKLAATLSLNPYLTAGLVEVLFGSLLFIRGRQRATQKNVPLFLDVGYFLSLGFVTGVNMWGLAQENALIGGIVGLTISGAMWLMETVLVWLWVDADKPSVKSIRDQMREAKRAIQEEKARQRIEWMQFEAQKLDLKLIKDARKAEQRRKEILEDGLPEFFQQHQSLVNQLTKKPDENYTADAYDNIAFSLQKQPQKADENPPIEINNETLSHQQSGQIEKQEIDDQKVAGQTAESNPKTTAKKKKSNHSKREKSIRKAFEKFVEEHGEKPGRIRLAKAAKCSNWEAQKFLESLGEEKQQYAS